MEKSSCAYFFNMLCCYFSPRIQPLCSGGPWLGRNGGMALCYSLSGDGDKTHSAQLSSPIRLCRYAHCQAELILKPLDWLYAASGAFSLRENWNVALNWCKHSTYAQIFSISNEHLQLHLVSLPLWCSIATPLWAPCIFLDIKSLLYILRYKGGSLVMKCSVI